MVIKKVKSRVIRKWNKVQKHMFLFEELTKRDFKHKYKGTMLGMGWSILAPLLTLLVLKMVFTEFFGRDTPHYTIYIFSGSLIMAYFKDSTKGGMQSLTNNANIFTKINMPKYLFLLSRNVSAFVNFLITLVLYFVFCAIDGISFSPRLLLLVFPITCLLLLNIGAGLILSALNIFFRDMNYLYDIFLTLLNYVSAVFYTLDRFPQSIQRLFLLNPVYVYIRYFRDLVIHGVIPSLRYHGLCILYPAILLMIGGIMYKKLNHKFLYYV